MRAPAAALAVIAIAAAAHADDPPVPVPVPAPAPAPVPAPAAATSPSPSEPSPALAALLAQTDAMAREVAHVRGLKLRHKIPNEVVDRAELRARLEKQAADHKTAAQTAAEGEALARWGLIPPGLDYTKLMVDVLTDQIAGYYDPDTKKLTISATAGDDEAWAELVLAHELDHGLQDQAFDLRKFEDLPDTEGDAEMARHALVEGDGIVLMLEVMLARQHRPPPWSNPEAARTIEQAMSAPTDDALDHAPLVVRESLMFPYRAGFAFVAALRRRHPWSAIDAAFRRPPRSTEQILHVDKYLADEKPVPVTGAVPASLPGYAIVHSTVWGELEMQLFLRAHGVADEVAGEAAAGWGGDRVLLLARPGDADPRHAIGLARFEWDSEADAIEAEQAATRALDDALVGASVTDGGRTRWLATDGTQAWVERRGSSLVMAIGVPSWAAEAVAADAWTALAPKP